MRNQKKITLERGMYLVCRHCQKEYDLAKASKGIRRGAVRCTNCNKKVGSI